MLQTIIQVIEVQALVWLGSMFAPLLPAVGCLALLLIFQTKYFLAMFLLSPPRVRFSAQRTSTLAYFLLLGERLSMANVKLDALLLPESIALCSLVQLQDQE